ncbi:MAG: hypothetical protein ACM3NF_09420 [Gemmatimonadota bacterium]
MRQVLVLVAASFAGTSLSVWWLSGFVPWFLLPDFSFLAIVYAGLFIPGPLGLLAALPPALFRELTVSAPPWSLFLSSLSLFFLAREIGLRLFIRAESFVLSTAAVLLLLESVSMVILSLLVGSRPFTALWVAKEGIRVAWTSLVAVPLFMDLSGRWQRVAE